MNYAHDRNGQEISRLGYGCMRFSRRGGLIDYGKAEREILHALELGVNYYDTAYVYPGSEECLGRILHENHCRDSALLATKLPQYLIGSIGAAEKYFQEELRRLRTDHVDFYLMHMLTDVESWRKLEKLGIRADSV